MSVAPAVIALIIPDCDCVSPSLPLEQEPCRAGTSELPSAASGPQGCVLDKAWNRHESQKVAAEWLGGPPHLG